MLKSFIKRVGIDMMEPTNDFAETMYEIEYTGSGKYVVSGSNVYGEKSSFKFDPGNRHAFVDKRTYDSLISQEFFTDPIPS
jgi:hypothetical protein